jgi:hypothetical protein
MRPVTLAAAAAVAVAAVSSLGGVVARAADGGDLKAPATFSGIADPAQRSAALFAEAGKVLQSPRCLNCHPVGNRPHQGNDGHLHVPAVQRGEGNLGVPGLYCGTCHGQANYDATNVPGNPEWALAPASLGWYGQPLSEVCASIKDPARNGGHSIAEVVTFAHENELVAWGWQPGGNRVPAPGSQEQFASLIKAWADTGAHCPQG